MVLDTLYALMSNTKVVKEAMTKGNHLLLLITLRNFFGNYRTQH